MDLSMIGLLLRTDLLARDRSAVTRVIEILQLVVAKVKRGKELYMKITIQSLVKINLPPLHSPPLKSVFQKVKQGFLHHICHLCGQSSQS